MAVAVTFVAILILLNVLFAAVFWTVRNVRRLTDEQMKASRLLESMATQENVEPNTQNNSESGSMEEGEDEEKDTAFEGLKKEASELGRSCFRECLVWYDVFFGCLLGYSSLADNVSRRFPEWEPLPYRCGVVVTCMLLVLSAVLLSPEVVLGTISAAPQLCSIESESKRLERKLAKVTNLDMARKQVEYTVGFHGALVNDTTLYGTTGHECKDIMDRSGAMLASGSKKNWSDSIYGPFFPGYCAEALEAAIFASKNTECTRTVCGCNFKVCLGGITEVCVETPYVCDQHTNDQVEELRDYRLEQQRRGSVTKTSSLKLKTYDNTVGKVQEIAEEVSAKIFRQMDIAGTLYIVYSCLTLFFPSPMLLFRTPFMRRVKQTTFGVQKHVFILMVVAIWWGVEYFQRLSFFTPNVQLYLEHLQTNPCYADPNYIQQRERAMTSTCMELMNMKSDFELSKVTIKSVIREVHHFVNTCDCKFPLNSLASFVSPDKVAEAGAAALGFKNTVENMCTDCLPRQEIFVPSESFSFIGNTTVCDNPDYARNQVLHEPETGLSWSEVWIDSGVLAHLIIKFVASNYCLNLLRVVDPLSDCGGRFEQPPPRYFNLDYEGILGVQNHKTSVLSRIAVIRSIIWGAIMNWCMLSLAFGIYSDAKGLNLVLNNDDVLISAILLALVPIIFCVACCVNHRIRKKIRSVQGAIPNTGTRKLGDDDVDDNDIQQDSGQNGVPA